MTRIFDALDLPECLIRFVSKYYKAPELKYSNYLEKDNMDGLEKYAVEQKETFENVCKKIFMRLADRLIPQAVFLIEFTCSEARYTFDIAFPEIGEKYDEVDACMNKIAYIPEGKFSDFKKLVEDTEYGCISKIEYCIDPGLGL